MMIRCYSPGHLVLQMQSHVISFYGVTPRIRFMFFLFPQVSRNWRYESEPPFWITLYFHLCPTFLPFTFSLYEFIHVNEALNMCAHGNIRWFPHSELAAPCVRTLILSKTGGKFFGLSLVLVFLWYVLQVICNSVPKCMYIMPKTFVRTSQRTQTTVRPSLFWNVDISGQPVVSVFKGCEVQGRTP